jgi:hypothetical protein
MRLRLPLSEREPQVVVFDDGSPEIEASPAVPATSLTVEGDWEFELKPVLDNRWGDYNWPPSPSMVGPEARRFRYAAETVPDPGWQVAALDDTRWQTVTSSFGPKFWKLGPLPDGFDGQALVGITEVAPGDAVEFRGRRYQWQPYEFSWRWGVEGDPGHQGYHGLKEKVPNEFIVLGRHRRTDTGSAYEEEDDGSRYFLWTSVAASRPVSARLLVGGNLPTAAWINHDAVTGAAAGVQLRAGANPLLLRYDQVGRGYAVVDVAQPGGQTEPAADDDSVVRVSPLAMFWYGKDRFLPFDAQPQAEVPAGWYRFTSPPGLRALSISSRGQVQAWAGGEALRPMAGGRFVVPQPSTSPVVVAARIRAPRGEYGGAALAGPILLDCGPGRIGLGDWSRIDGLASYSGGAWYRKTVSLPSASHVMLDLGEVVATAEVRVNGRSAGIRVAPPWRFDVSALVKAGDNRIEVLVYNTLSNHYSTIPTRYRGRTTSGLLGPVNIELGPSVVGTAFSAPSSDTDAATAPSGTRPFVRSRQRREAPG